ncbi:PREDICTED: uncharacterized protein LOC107193937 [Dufourea novaeangliae]|uniref:uncharacterized protein LOC107193937 n=1 Tax=Dufourea novaeangliae TaxID=178035 RepID=UPI000767BDD8|nr:PREDICTED: uncharacterized protein LOC107193937 [Dufourea novaeangliae]
MSFFSLLSSTLYRSISQTLAFFCTSDNAKHKALCFRETLIMCLKNESAKNTKPIGGCCILIESMGPQALEFLIHMQNSMSHDGHFWGTKVITSATSKLHCLEEKRTVKLNKEMFNSEAVKTSILTSISKYFRFVYKDNGLHERSIYMGLEGNFYHVKLTHICPCDEFEKTTNLSYSSNDRLISDGVDILLVRYLAQINYEGTLRFETINIDGELTTVIYECTSAERMEIDGHFLNVYTIECKLHMPKGSVDTARIHLTSKGRILRYNWLDSPYIAKINPLADPNIASNTLRLEAPLRDNWSKDIEMLSKYLDKKFSKIAEYTEYLADHPQVKQLISDYTQTLLVGNYNWINIIPTILTQYKFLLVSTVKPENVIDFTIQHFKAFAKNPITWETSTENENYDIDILSQLKKEKPELVCDICGFSMDSSTSKASSSRSAEAEYSDIASLCDSMQSVHSYDVSTSKSSTKSTSLEKESSIHEKDSHSKIACNKCHTIMRTCDKYQPISKCPGCLKVINLCPKCFTIDQIIRRLKK